MYFKQITEIIEGRKTCTQRVIKPGEPATVVEREIVAVRDAHGRMKWQVGRDYAVSPGRGKMTVQVKRSDSGKIFGWVLPSDAKMREANAALDYESLRIRITKIEHVTLHSMDEHVALAEGVENTSAYIDLWNSINGVKAWDANPMVWRLWFEIAAEQPADGGEGA